MENASKALLIAGAILIAILLISMGIKTINSTSGLQEQVDTTTQITAVSTFNAQFTPYIGNSTSGTKAKSLVSKVLAHNATVSSSSTFSADSHQILLNLYDKNNNKISKHGNYGHQWKSDELQYLYNQINDAKKYKIWVTPGCEYAKGSSKGYYNGYILCISIKEKN